VHVGFGRSIRHLPGLEAEDLINGREGLGEVSCERRPNDPIKDSTWGGKVELGVILIVVHGLD